MQQPLQTDKQNIATNLTEPFENIALSFSGGGFRAASYALGVFSYFNYFKVNEEDREYPLLRKVTYLSSASGGTIATAMYALNNAQGKSFGEFYKNLFEKLEGMKLLNRVFEILNNKVEWKKRKLKRRNLINAFALAYNEMLFENCNVSDILSNASSHLEEVCFNSSEFYRGLLFRQAIKVKPDSKKDEGFLYGNFVINLSGEATKKLKLADILAASSCFPAGFEPIIFPDDFTHDDATPRFFLNNLTIELQEYSWDELYLLYNKDKVRETLKKLPSPVTIDQIEKALEDLPLKDNFKIGLMDGGITDNQGLESMVRANDRRIKGETDFKPFNLMFANDVSSHYMDPYELPKKKNTGGTSLKALSIFSGIAILLGCSGIYFCFSGFAHPILSKLSGILGILVLVFALIVFIFLDKSKQFVRNKFSSGSGSNLENNFSKEMIGLLFKYFGSTPISIIWRMLKERITSVLTLNTDVFLKRIRQMLYQRVFETDKWKLRVKTNHLYDLTFTNDRVRLQNESSKYTPSTSMQIVSEEAFNMGTTLWFDSQSQKECKQASIIACGQFTSCFNLLQYIDKVKMSDVYHNLSDFYKKRLDTFELEMTDHFVHFQKDPFWLYNQLGKDYISNDWVNHELTDSKLPKNFNGLR